MGVIRIKQNGNWAPVRGLYRKHAGSWSAVQKAFVKRNGEWEQVYPAPAGILSFDNSSLSFNTYQHYDSSIQRVNVTNTGDHPLTINSIASSTNAYYTVRLDLTGMGNTSSNIVMEPGDTKYIDVKIFGDHVGTAISQINFNFDSGVLGIVDSAVTVNGTSLTDYASVSVSPSGVSYSTYVDHWYSVVPWPIQDVTVTNNGNGGTLHIYAIASTTGKTAISNVPSEIGSYVGDNIFSLSSNSAAIRLTPTTAAQVGTYSDNITMTTNLGITTIPVSYTVNDRYAEVAATPSSYNYSSIVNTAPPSTNIILTNTGNGGVLTISNISSSSGTVITNKPSSINPGQHTTFTITAPSGKPVGIHTDYITVVTDAGNISIPVYYSVIDHEHGTQTFTSPGTTTWKVPVGVVSVTATAIGGGGGGGASTEVGNGQSGGGGGSGGVNTQTISVTPGSFVSITVGRGGAGGPYTGRTSVASSGSAGSSSNFGSVTAGGGGGGIGGHTDGSGGTGGAAGSPGGTNGQNGTTGTNDHSSTVGGTGGSNGSGYGTGGTGASAPDRVSPFNWAGNPGATGAVTITW